MRTLIVALLFLVSTAVFAQDSLDTYSLEEHPYRDPHRAKIIATILPGAGYVYTGEYLRGYGTWVVTASGFILGPTMLSLDCYGFFSTRCGNEEHAANILVGSLLIASSIVTWVSSVRDAPKSAERANERRRRRELKVRPTIRVPQTHTGVNAGLSVAW